MFRRIIAISMMVSLPLFWAASTGTPPVAENDASQTDAAVEQTRPFKIFYWTALPPTPINIEDQVLAVEMMARTGIDFDV